MLDNAERSGIEESYISTASSSNLRTEADKTGDADILIASGWSPARVGGALMRLHSEYGRVPRNATKTDHRLMMMQLKTLPYALDALANRAAGWNFERPSRVAMAVVSHWLDHSCRICDGQRFLRIKDTPVLSTKHCKSCHGVGKIALPYGEAGRRVEEYMLGCLQAWKSSTAWRLFRRR